jgi:hypothetical protein
LLRPLLLRPLLLRPLLLRMRRSAAALAPLDLGQGRGSKGIHRRLWNLLLGSGSASRLRLAAPVHGLSVLHGLWLGRSVLHGLRRLALLLRRFDVLLPLLRGRLGVLGWSLLGLWPRRHLLLLLLLLLCLLRGLLIELGPLASLLTRHGRVGRSLLHLWMGLSLLLLLLWLLWLHWLLLLRWTLRLLLHGWTLQGFGCHLGGLAAHAASPGVGTARRRRRLAAVVEAL